MDANIPSVMKYFYMGYGPRDACMGFGHVKSLMIWDANVIVIVAVYFK